MSLKQERRFRQPGDFQGESDTYFLLPFRFHTINEAREVLVNEVGDYLFCPRGTATRVANRAVGRSEPIYADLLGSFMISEKPVPDLIEVIATRYRTKKSFLDSFTSLHIFVVTLRCNHSCHYCQVSRQTEDKSQFDMSRDHLDRAITLMFESPADHLTVEFQGGEPLVAFENVRHAVEEVEKRNKQHGRRLTFVLCTNLAGVGAEVLEFCAEHRILISTSLDGAAFIHNANRPSPGIDSYESFVDGLERARSALGHDRVSALMTTSRLSLSHPRDIVDAYVQHGFNHIFLRPLHPYGFATRLRSDRRYTAREFTDFYKAALQYILDLNRRGVQLVEDYAAIILRKILTPFPTGFVDLQSPAGPVASVIVYNYDGGVFASDESRMLAETGDLSFRLGHVTDPYSKLFYGTKAHHIVGNAINEALAGCADCGLQAYCGADPVRNHATQGDLAGYRPSSGFCQTNMEVIRYLLDLMDSDPGAERILRSWVQ